MRSSRSRATEAAYARVRQSGIFRGRLQQSFTPDQKFLVLLLANASDLIARLIAGRSLSVNNRQDASSLMCRVLHLPAKASRSQAHQQKEQRRTGNTGLRNHVTSTKKLTCFHRRLSKNNPPTIPRATAPYATNIVTRAILGE